WGVAGRERPRANRPAVEPIAVRGAPGALAVDPKKKFLSASLRPPSARASFGTDPATGKLKPLSTARLPKGENAAYVGTDRTGRWLLSASYAAGKVVVHGIQADGTIQTPAVQTVATAKTASRCRRIRAVITCVTPTGWATRSVSWRFTSSGMRGPSPPSISRMWGSRNDGPVGACGRGVPGVSSSQGVAA